MEGARCLDSNILYHAKVEEEGKPDAGYVGLTAKTFKVRYGNHKTSFKNSAKGTNSSLAGACLATQGWQPSLHYHVESAGHLH